MKEADIDPRSHVPTNNLQQTVSLSMWVKASMVVYFCNMQDGCTCFNLLGEVSLLSTLTFAKEAAFQFCLRAFAPQKGTGLFKKTIKYQCGRLLWLRQRGPNRNQPTIVLLPAIISWIKMRHQCLI